MCGDFNEILGAEDRSGVGGLFAGSMLFSDFVNNQSLRDVDIFYAFYTWSNLEILPPNSKLDRFLLSTEWDATFPFLKAIARPRPVSDHIPLVLCGK